MDVNRTGALDAELAGGVRQGGLREQRLRRNISIRHHLVDNQLILTFDRQVDPGLRGMNVQVPATETVTTVRRNLAPMREHAVLEIVDVERARIFWVGPLWIVAARTDEHGLVGGRRPDLMEVDALFDL